MLEQIISGGQTGADTAGLLAAEACEIPTGGWMPCGWLTENGPRPDLAKRFGLQMHKSKDYRDRTRQNVIESDGTLIIATSMDTGSGFTWKWCQRLGKPAFHISGQLRPVHEVRSDGSQLMRVAGWIEENRIKTLNIAGNRESKDPGLQDRATVWLRLLFEHVNGLNHHSNQPPGRAEERKHD